MRSDGNRDRAGAPSRREETTLLLRRAKDGSPEALDELFRRWAGRLLALIRVRLGPALRARVESRDILQAVLLKAFQRIDRFERSDARSLMAWLARIADNEIRDQADYHGRARRDAGREVPLAEGDDRLAGGVRSQISQLVLDERLARLERALDSLDRLHREVIVLRRIEELTFEEIGRRLGRSPDASRMLFARAMTALTLNLGDPD